MKNSRGIINLLSKRNDLFKKSAWIIVALEIGSKFLKKSFMVFVKIEKTVLFERENRF